MSSEVLLYAGEGAGKFCVTAMQKQMEAVIDDRKHKVRVIKSFSEGLNDPKSVKAQVVGGGNAVLMTKAIEKPQVIKELFKKHAIGYYGVCAGGILATSTFYDAIPSFYKIDNGFSDSASMLSLYPGRAVGPLFPKPLKGGISTKEFLLRPVETIKAKVVAAHILSPGYLSAEGEVLARYDDLPVYKIYEKGPFVAGSSPFKVKEEIDAKLMAESVFYQAEGAGPVLLSGAHLEIDSELVMTQGFLEAFNAEKSEQKALSEKLKEGDKARLELLTANFKRLGISCKPGLNEPD